MQSILEQYQQQGSVPVKVKLLHLLGEIAFTPGFHTARLVEDLLSLLASAGKSILFLYHKKFLFSIKGEKQLLATVEALHLCI